MSKSYSVGAQSQPSNFICPLALRLPGKALRACFLRNMDKYFEGVSIPISKKRFTHFQVLLEAITVALRPHVYLKSAITRIYRINGIRILSVDDFCDGDIVVCCCQYETFVEVDYNVNPHYLRTLGSIIRMRNKLLPAVDDLDLYKGDNGRRIDYKNCLLPQAILLYIDVKYPMYESKSVVLFEGYGRARRDKQYIIKMVDKEHMYSQSNYSYSEIEILRQLQGHPNIIDLVYTVEHIKYIYIVFERLDCDLNDLLTKSETFPEAVVKKIMKDVSQGLKYIHECLIIHRDIKLDNLLVQLDYSVTPEPRIAVVKITDFGLATYYNGELQYQWCGTSYYMAPELINYEGYDFSVDLWSLGVTLFYLLFGELPFGNYAGSSDTIFKCIRTLPHQIPFGSSSKFSPQALQLVDSLLVKSPQHRLSVYEVCQHPFLTDG